MSERSEAAEAAEEAPPPAVRSEELLRGNRELTILHREERYRLRLTRQGKLILTK